MRVMLLDDVYAEHLTIKARAAASANLRRQLYKVKPHHYSSSWLIQ